MKKQNYEINTNILTFGHFALDEGSCRRQGVSGVGKFGKMLQLDALFCIVFELFVQIVRFQQLFLV